MKNDWPIISTIHFCSPSFLLNQGCSFGPWLHSYCCPPNPLLIPRSKSACVIGGLNAVIVTLIPNNSGSSGDFFFFFQKKKILPALPRTAAESASINDTTGNFIQPTCRNALNKKQPYTWWAKEMAAAGNELARTQI